VSSRLLSYLKSADLVPPLQLPYRTGHSTETAVTKMLMNILLALYHSDFTALTLLDLSAAVETVDHTTLI